MTMIRVVFVWLFVANNSGGCHGWGKIGHEMVGNVAWRLLTSSTQEMIQQILNESSSSMEYNSDNLIGEQDRLRVRSAVVASTTEKDSKDDCLDCSPMGQVADWADEIRRYRIFRWSGPLHYIDVRDDLVVPRGCPVQFPEERQQQRNNYNINLTCDFDYVRDCPNDICVAGSIVNYTQQLQQLHLDTTTTSNNKKQLRESLMFLIHFVGDIHQPLHSSRSTDRGGNNIQVHFPSSFSSSSVSSSSLTPKQQQQKLPERIPNFHLRNRFNRRSTTTTRKLQAENNNNTITSTLTTTTTTNTTTIVVTHTSHNLHAVWDDAILERHLKLNCNNSRPIAEDVLYGYILQQATHNTPIFQKWLQCLNGALTACTTLWGKESLDDALVWAYRNTDDDDNNDNSAAAAKEITNGTVLTESYYETRLPVVQERLAAASIRLASTLVLALSSSASSTVTTAEEQWTTVTNLLNLFHDSSTSSISSSAAADDDDDDNHHSVNVVATVQ